MLTNVPPSRQLDLPRVESSRITTQRFEARA